MPLRRMSASHRLRVWCRSILQARASPDQRSSQSVRASRTRKSDRDQPLCPECGTPLFWEGDIVPGIVGIAVGGFVDPDFPPPIISFFEKYKHPWVGFNHE